MPPSWKVKVHCCEQRVLCDAQVPLAALGAPVVGIIAESIFGYDASGAGKKDTPMPPAERAANARALGNGIFVVVAIPFVVCAAIYSLLYRAYPRDRARALQAQEVAMVRDPSFVGLPCSGLEAGEVDSDTEMGDLAGSMDEAVPSASAGEGSKLLAGLNREH